MVNFVFSVAHFCEIHGPVTVLCTQKHETGASATQTSQALCESCSFELPSGVSSLISHCKESEPNTARSNTSQPDPARFSTQLNSDQSPPGVGMLTKVLSREAKNKEYSVPNAETLIYASTLYPQSERIFTCLTKLVMKCLSVEAVAEPLKPVFFGDTSTGYCLSRIYSIPDLHARGGERKYALMVISDSERALLSNWDVASTFIAEIIALLQSKVEIHMEQRKLDGMDNGRYLRRAKTIPRSLVQLTGDPEIFMKLHLCGMELLKSMHSP